MGITPEMALRELERRGRVGGIKKDTSAEARKRATTEGTFKLSTRELQSITEADLKENSRDTAFRKESKKPTAAADQNPSKNTYSNAQSVRLPEQQIPSSARPQTRERTTSRIWGQPGYPLLPIPFRDATPISPKLALLSGCSTSSELDATFWATHESAPKALLEAVLVEAVRRADIHGKYLLGPYPIRQLPHRGRSARVLEIP